MPMIDVTIPEGALKPEAEARLLKELTDILITHEGFDVGNKVAQAVSVVFLHRPAAVFVGGERSPFPRSRLFPPFLPRFLVPPLPLRRRVTALCRRCRKGSIPMPRANRW
jgi:phenylpyruvate tautomerase PptA (4-oxalocrotonate tautomerase family)